MEFKKKTLIWEDNTEPPKNHIWVKADGKAYEYSYSQGKWIESKSISTSSNRGSDSDYDIQIVELTYDHIPATGTLSASDLAKLDSDNCLLVMKGKYFRKTFSSDGGIDYKEIGLATVLGGVRSIYFTASKPDGEYTIAYKYPVEANTQTQATTPLENIKVGNTTYSVPLSPMVIAGTVSNDAFTPGDGAHTYNEALEHMFQGGLVYLLQTFDGEPYCVRLAEYASSSNITAGATTWLNPNE